MKFYIIDQKITDISEFHTYINHTLLPSQCTNGLDVFDYECDFSQREKLSMLVVRNAAAQAMYMDFLHDKNSDDVLLNKNTFKLHALSEQPMAAWQELLEKVSNDHYLVFTGKDEDYSLEVLREGENKLVLWNSDMENKAEIFEKLWQEKSCFYIVKNKYLLLFKSLIAEEKIVFKDIKNFFDCIAFLGIISDGGNTVILLSALNDINFIANAMTK